VNHMHDVTDANGDTDEAHARAGLIRLTETLIGLIAEYELDNEVQLRMVLEVTCTEDGHAQTIGCDGMHYWPRFTDDSSEVPALGPVSQPDFVARSVLAQVRRKPLDNRGLDMSKPQE
jgi:hypothetical protein